MIHANVYVGEFNILTSNDRSSYVSGRQPTIHSPLARAHAGAVNAVNSLTRLLAAA